MPITRLENASGAARPQHSCQVEHSLSFRNGIVSVRRHTWAGPSSYIWKSDSHYVSLALGRRRDLSWASYLDAPRAQRQAIGQIMLVPAGRTIQTGGPEGAERSLACFFSDELFEDILPDGPQWSELALNEGLHISNPDVQWLLLNIYREIKEGQVCSAIVIESLMVALAVALVRQFGLAEPAARKRSGGLAPWRMRRIGDRLAADLPPPTVAELAELAQMSVRHLTRAFKAETGHTVARHVQQAVVDRARVLLAEANLPIGEIAQKLGFASHAAFSTAFRKATGLRPSDVARHRGFH